MDRHSVIKNNFTDIFNYVIKYDYYLEGVVDVEYYNNSSIEILKVLSDSRIITYHGDDTIRIQNGNEQSIILSNTLSDMVILPDNRVCVIKDSNIIRIFNPDTKEYDLSFMEHNDSISQIMVMGTKILSIDDSKNMYIWDPVTGKMDTKLHTIKSIISVAVLPNNKIAVTSGINIHIIDLITEEVDFILEGDYAQTMIYLFLRPDGQLISISNRNNMTIRVWDLHTRKSIELFTDYYVGAYMQVIKNQYIIGIINDEEINFLNINTGLRDFRYMGHRLNFDTQNFILPDGRIAMSWNSGILIFNTYDLPKGKSLWINPQLRIEIGFIFVKIALLFDGRIVSSSNDSEDINRKLIIWK